MKSAFYVGLGHSRHIERYRWGRGRTLEIVTLCGRVVNGYDVHPSPRDADCGVCVRSAMSRTVGLGSDEG